MTSIEPFQPAHLPQLQELINNHLSAIAPGWALPEAYIHGRLLHNPGQFVLDPWVIARTTLCALERQRVVAAAHLLRYGAGPEVGTWYQGVGDIAWLLAWSNADRATADLLAAAQREMEAWGVTQVYAWNAGLPIGPFVGVPDAWPHITSALVAAGYRQRLAPDAAVYGEAIYGGRLDPIALPTAPPVPGLEVRRLIGSDRGVRFAALVGDQVVGACECVSDLTDGGALPALRGWAELTEMEVAEPWRNRGIGAWLVQHAAAWLRLGGCDRMILAVAAENEAAGAGRFYQRFGWEVFVRQQDGWVWSDTTIDRMEV
jgi:GNAT superfamily N-acetyltransferase